MCLRFKELFEDSIKGQPYKRLITSEQLSLAIMDKNTLDPGEIALFSFHIDGRVIFEQESINALLKSSTAKAITATDVFLSR